jgi:xanthine dehydrogenase YagR molybdenum-binding subunit
MTRIGDAVTRTDARRKVTGAATYAGDVMPAGMLHAHLVTSDIAVGRVTSVDAEAARAAPGVVAVYDHEGLPGWEDVRGFYAGGPGSTSFWPMKSPEIRYAGQPVAIVLGETAAAARRGAHLVRVAYEEAPSAIHMELDTAFTVDKRNGEPDVLTKGDLEAGLAEAAATVDMEFTTPYQHHNAMEMFSTTAEWRGDRLTVWMPSQSVRTLRGGIAMAFGLAETEVRVISPFVGGAFGSKAGITPYTAIAIAAAKAIGRPVRLVTTRPQMYTTSVFRPESLQRFRLGADAEGRLTAFEHVETAQTPRFDNVVNPGTHYTRAMYACPNIRTEQRLARSDTNTGGFMRAPNEMQTFFGMEVAMDALADRLGVDPVEMRRVNDTDTHPTEGMPFSARSLVECFDAVSDSFGWTDRPATATRTDGDWMVGYGCATATYPTNILASNARIRMQGTGHAYVELAAHDVGTGTYTILAQIAAQRLGLDIGAVDVVMGEADLPVAPLSGGSTTAASAGSAVDDACRRIATQLASAMAAQADTPLSGLDPADIAFGDGMLTGPDGQSMSIQEAVQALPPQEIEVVGEFRHPAHTPQLIRATFNGGYGTAGPVTDRRAMYAFGAEMAEVHVHRWTHEIRVPRLHGAFAAGTWLNRKTAHSQLMGGMVWGVGSALHEVTEVDIPRARYLNANIAEYLIPVNADIRELRVEMLEEEDDYVNPLGVKGIGEIGIVGTAAAIGNAIHNATGRRLTALPFQIPDMV